MIFPEPPISAINASVACMAAALTSDVTTKSAGVGSLVGPPKFTIVAPFAVSSSYNPFAPLASAG